MAGKRLQHTLNAEIKRRGGDDHVLERVAAGETVGGIAETLGVSRPMLNNWLLHAHRRERYALAKQQAAGAMVEQSLAIVDAADVASVQLAKLQSETRRWIAGKLDREAWGEQQGPQTLIQINTLHSGMLRQRDTDE